MQSYGREDSWGISQIHLPAHPTIKKEQALDPIWSLSWMADRWQEGDEWMWSCHKILAKKQHENYLLYVLN